MLFERGSNCASSQMHLQKSLPLCYNRKGEIEQELLNKGPLP